MITNKTIRDVISGISKVAKGAAIEAASSHLKRVQGTSALAKGSKQHEQEEIELLKSYITDKKLWASPSVGEIISKPSAAQGMEQKVYLKDENTVIKLNDAICYLSWEDYLYSLLLHNFFFPITAYELIGFTETENKLYSIVEQPLIKATSITDIAKVKAFMLENGFTNIRNNDYRNPELGIILEDLHDENVLTKDDTLYFIDTIFFIDKPKTYNQGGTVMPIIKKSEQTIEQMEKEIAAAKKNPLLPENLKKKYVELMEGRIKEKKATSKEESLIDERGEKYSANSIQIKGKKAYYAGMPIDDVTYNQKNKLSWYTVSAIGVGNMKLGEIVLSKENFKKLAEIVNPRIITIEKLATGGTLSSPKGTDKIKKVMKEFKKGELKTSSGQKVKNPKQAVAIALSEQRAEEKTGKGVKALAAGISKENKELIEREKAKIAKRKKLK